MLRRLALLHPFLMAVSPILFLGSVKIDQVLIETMFIQAAFALVATMVVFRSMRAVCGGDRLGVAWTARS